MAQYDDLMSKLDMSQLAQRVGAGEAETREAVERALPALFGGMQLNAQQPQGAQSLMQALGQHQDDLADGPVDVERVDAEDGQKIVSHVFGDQRETVVNQLGGFGGGQGSGIIAKLLPILAPIVMSYLAKKMGGSGAPTQAGAAPGGQGGLDSVLGDLLGGMFGGGAGQPGQTGGAGGSGGPFNTPAGSQRPQQQQSGGLGDLLGSILRGR